MSKRNALNPLAIFRFVTITVLLNLGTLPNTGFSTMTEKESETSPSADNRLISLLIHLEQSLHFDAPDGQDTVVSPGIYLVEPIIPSPSQLFLWHEHGTVTLQATRTTHDQPLNTPEAYLIREEAKEDMHHVIVFLPDGVALEATGSVSGIETRGNFRVTRHYQLDAATGVVRFGDGQQDRRLPIDQSNFSAQYREGSGSQESELNVIKLQSGVDQRQRSLALAQNLLNKLHGRFQLEENIDRPSNDYARHMEDSPEACRTRCAGDGNCQAFTFVKPSPNSTQGQCFLKRSEPKPVANHCCVSGTRSSTQEKIMHNIR